MSYFEPDSPVFRRHPLAHPAPCATCGAPPKAKCVTSAGRPRSGDGAHAARRREELPAPSGELRVIHVRPDEDIPTWLTVHERAQARADLVTALTGAGVSSTRAGRLALKVVPVFTGVRRPAGPGRWRNVA